VKSCTYSNLLTQHAVDAFAAAFQQMRLLKVLNLSYSNLNDALSLALSEHLPNGLTKLNLKHCSFSAAGLDPLLETLMSSSNGTLLKLNLSGNNLAGVRNLGRFLSKSHSLEELKLSNSRLTDMELKQLGNGLKINRALRVLDLSQN
jgi:Ran GTPase-activating protein (RanGAP) involved in mRNA processing and transport